MRGLGVMTNVIRELREHSSVDGDVTEVEEFCNQQAVEDRRLNNRKEKIAMRHHFKFFRLGSRLANIYSEILEKPGISRSELSGQYSKVNHTDAWVRSDINAMKRADIIREEKTDHRSGRLFIVREIEIR